MEYCFVAGTDGTLKVYHTVTQKFIKNHGKLVAHGITAMVISHNNRYLFIAGGCWGCI